MKVALITEWLDAWRGGAETSTLQFLHHLMDQNVEVHVFTRSRPSPTPGLHIHTISGAAMTRTRRSVTFAHRVDRMLKENKFDVVHAISPCQGATLYQPRGGTVAETIARNLALIQPASLRRAKQALNYLNFKQRYLLSMERKLFSPEAGPVIVALSDYVIRQLKQHYRLPDRRIRKIYNGVDPDLTPTAQRQEDRQAIRREFGISEDDFLVLMVAHNFRLKGVPRWMEALAQLKSEGDRRVCSLILGKGDTPRWHSLAQRLKITDRLTFTGPTQRVHAFFHAADLLVHPTYYDPCSRVVLEALVSGLTCVTTKWDGSSEMIEEGQNGYVLDNPDDVGALVKLVNQIASKKHRVDQQAPANQLAERVSMKRHTQQMLELYEELAGTNAAPS